MLDAAFWDTVFWGNTVMRWAIAAGVGIGVVLVLRVVMAVLAAQLKRLARATENDVDDLVADLLDRTKLLFVVIVGERDTENRHHCVSNEFVQHPTLLLNHLDHDGEVLVQQGYGSLWAEFFSEGREAADV